MSRGHRSITGRDAPRIPLCYLAALGQMRDGSKVPPCDGQLVKVHLIKRSFLRINHLPQWDNRVWVWACGGLMGNCGHHGMLDHGHRPMILPRSAIPEGVEEFALEHGIVWWLDREYGERDERDLRRSA